MEHYKPYCKIHPLQPITNFCLDPNCLTGLCATCIGEHTNSHLLNNTMPVYENIKDTYTRYGTRMRGQIQKMEQDKLWLDRIVESMKKKKDIVSDTLRKARMDCIDTINRHFDELQGKIQIQILNANKKHSLHLSHRMETINTLINKQISSLLIYASDMASTKFLDTVGKVEREILPGNDVFHAKIGRELKENQLYTPGLQYRKEVLGQIQGLLKRLVNLQFVLPNLQFLTQINNCVARPSSMQKQRVSIDRSRPVSITRNPSVILTPKTVIPVNFSAFTPKRTSSIVLTTVPPAFTVNRNQSQLQPMMRTSRLGGDLKIIKETKREASQIDSSSSLASSVCIGKQNQLATSTFYESGCFFKK